MCSFVDCHELVPGVGEIVFCNRDREGNSTMTWSYSIPRVISAVSSTPVPFNTDMMTEGGNKVSFEIFSSPVYDKLLLPKTHKKKKKNNKKIVKF